MSNLPYSEDAYYQAHLIAREANQESNLPLIRSIAIALDAYYLEGVKHGEKINQEKNRASNQRARTSASFYPLWIRS